MSTIKEILTQAGFLSEETEKVLRCYPLSDLQEVLQGIYPNLTIDSDQDIISNLSKWKNKNTKPLIRKLKEKKDARSEKISKLVMHMQGRKFSDAIDLMKKINYTHACDKDLLLLNTIFSGKKGEETLSTFVRYLTTVKEKKQIVLPQLSNHSCRNLQI